MVEIFFVLQQPPQPNPSTNPAVQQRVLWDRKIDGGFPETKELKRRVRDAIEPGRNLGHVDKDYGTSSKAKPGEGAAGTGTKPSISEAENALGLNTHPDVNIGGPSCKPGVESTRTNARTEECEDCK